MNWFKRIFLKIFLGREEYEEAVSMSEFNEMIKELEEDFERVREESRE